eukprot:TRINITY_DN14667_c0_g1_i1.p1 TRINITY_DN14667_c0_g1~~TRINITY_DN14667_c0_g1_i1.p1  ORF type:complete len:522 (+),score=132.48 TRINITY_DN14667_c0_g1_i1:229-1566(+)
MGEGSFGTVFKATCKQSKTLRAVKAIERKNVKNPARFEREIEIAKKLDHPNVVRLFETFRDARKIYLVMEICSGGELFDRIVDEAPNGFDEAKAASYVRQMLSAISYLHTQRFCHRDVKPENFLFQSRAPEASLKIIDFGLACQFEPGVPMRTKAGTAYYVSPDVLRGEYDEKCDVWSIGVITYILLCGSPPFSGENDAEILRKVRVGKFEFRSPEWDTVSPGAKNLITQMMTVDPALRPTAEALLHTAWLKFKGTPEPAPISDSLVKRLQGFTAHSKLKKVALTAVAKNLPDDALKDLLSTFQTLDTKGNGMLSPESIREALVKQGLPVPEALEDILKKVDTNGSGSLDYTEFVAATIDQKTYMKRDICWAAFRTFDLDGDGKITHAELEQVLNSGNVQQALGAGKIAQMIKEVDVNGDGCIDFEEFCTMMAPPSSPAAKRRKT